MIVKKMKKSFRFQQIGDYFREYCTSTGIHGFRYFGEKRTIFERIWWAVVFLASLSACSYVIYLVYIKWESSPVIVSFATEETSIYNIPFPVVTVCPETKYDTERFNFTELKLNATKERILTNNNRKKLEYMSLICQQHPLIKSTLERSYHINPAIDPVETLDFFNEIRPDFSFLRCSFMGKPIDCEKILIPVITEEGICHTFNMADRSELFKDIVVHYEDFQQVNATSNWSIEHGYSEQATLNSSYPKRVEKTGVTNGLTFYFHIRNSDLDYSCRDTLQGYRVALHTAVRLPSPSTQYFRVPWNKEVLAAVQPEMITTSKAVKKYSPDTRGCYFTEERTLKYYNKYSKFNCWMECLTNYTYDLCKCVSFFMPRENGTRFCGFRKLQCMQDAKELMEFEDLSYQILKSKKTKRNARIKIDECNCLPLCADLSYDVETSQTPFELIKGTLAFYEDYGYTVDEWAVKRLEKCSMSKLTIFLKSSHFISSERHELYGPTDFLANFGGLLGLFTGFSILSLMEIIYFLSVRIICNIKLYGSWPGPQGQNGQEIC